MQYDGLRVGSDGHLRPVLALRSHPDRLRGRRGDRRAATEAHKARGGRALRKKQTLMVYHTLIPLTICLCTRGGKPREGGEGGRGGRRGPRVGGTRARACACRMAAPARALSAAARAARAARAPAPAPTRAPAHAGACAADTPTAALLSAAAFAAEAHRTQRRKGGDGQTPYSACACRSARPCPERCTAG